MSLLVCPAAERGHPDLHPDFDVFEPVLFHDDLATCLPGYPTRTVLYAARCLGRLTGRHEGWQA